MSNIVLTIKMYRMQLLDNRHLLIKYVCMDTMVSTQRRLVATLHRPPPPPPPPPPPLFTLTRNTNNNASTTTTTTTSRSFAMNPQHRPVDIMQQQQQQQREETSRPSVPSTSVPNMINENTTLFYFVLYDMERASVLNIMRNSSPQLLDTFEHMHDYFALTAVDGLASHQQHHTLASSNMHARQAYERNVKAVCKFNSSSEMTKCILAQLPVSSQSYVAPPYLDHSLFSYDEKLVSNIERPKPVSDHLIKMFSRDTGRLSFKIYTSMQQSATFAPPAGHPPSSSSNSTSSASSTSSSSSSSTSWQAMAGRPGVAAAGPISALRRLVAIIWHPREPFCISIQRTSIEYTVNFHVLSKNELI